MIFRDRVDAGRELASRLTGLRGKPVVVLGLPRGGVPVAAEVAHALDAPLDVIVVRKLGVPFQPELAMGAVGEDGVRVIDPDVLRAAGVHERDLAAVEERERAEVSRRAQRFREGRERADLNGRIAVIVDDGIATGSTAKAACRIARALGADRVVLAVPVAPPGWPDRIGRDADETVAVATPEHFFAIGQFYLDFSQTSDDEVIRCLARADLEHRVRSTGQGDDPGEGVDSRSAEDPPLDAEVDVVSGTASLPGRLTIPAAAAGIVVFAHGSGSGRHSPRNRYVAGVLNQAGLGTLLFDLLTLAEESDRSNVFNIPLLARRLGEATGWLRTHPAAAVRPIGYFGASTGAAAALLAAAEPDADIAAVVSRGGRPDLAGPMLGAVRAPTLLIVGSEDQIVLGLNEQARGELRCPSELAVVAGATHLFEEPGALAQAADLARAWFIRHFAGRSIPRE
jgi:putative phosphoribosyl transferase